MVRAGVVGHPRQWQWQGYHEIMGIRQRYRLLDLDRLCWRLGTQRIEEVRENLEAMIRETLAKEEMQRIASWTESLAVGSEEFVKRIQPLILSRRETQIIESASGVWTLNDAEIPYTAKITPKPAPKP